jgi:hypothetical protein
MGDLFMSLIHSCEPCGANPFELSDRTAAECGGAERQTLGLEAVELPGDGSVG